MIIYNVNIPSNVPSMDKSNEQITYNMLIITSCFYILHLYITLYQIKRLNQNINT